MTGAPRGPVPKKDAERRRRNKTTESGDSIAVEVVNLDEMIAGEVEIPPVDPKWHPIARHFYESLMRSGQAIWLEPSDWAVAVILAESLSRDLNPQPIGINEETGKPVMATVPLKGSSLSSYLKAFSALLVTEGDRRRLRIELERQKRIDEATGGDNVVDIVQARADLFKKQG